LTQGDLSRLGRNYIEVGKLTEEFFPQYDVRLVAVSDGVDSDEGDNEFTPFRNIMNNLYYISTVFINGWKNSLSSHFYGSIFVCAR